MTDLFDFTARATTFAVMGNPVKHSKSPQIHDMFASQCRVNMEYQRIQVDPGGFGQAVSHFAAHGGGGLNITVPYKVDAWQLCQRAANQCSDRAQLAEAVNTLRFDSGGVVYGDNTDGCGIVTDIQQNLGFPIRDRSILVVGAGGAVRGILGPIFECRPARITIANRTVSKASDLAARFDSGVDSVALDQCEDQTYDMVINGTATSLGQQLPGISPSCIAAQTLVYDMMYSLQPTVFMQWALSSGAASAHDGLGMLVEQAAESFYIWHGVRPDTVPVLQALRKS